MDVLGVAVSDELHHRWRQWLAPETLGEIQSARAPDPGTLRDLLKARLLAASKSNSKEAKDLYAKDPEHTRVIRFRRNFGKSAALAAGFDESRYDVIFTTSFDL